MTKKATPHATLNNPFEAADACAADLKALLASTSIEQASPAQQYPLMQKEAEHLRQRAKSAAPARAVARQHSKGRMTAWERIAVLADEGSTQFFFQNHGSELDGGALVTAVIQIEGRDVAVYGHDFTIRAGSMDATNGRKLAALFEMAGQLKIPLVGLNDSAGAFVPAGVGGLDGYACAFAALRRISGVVPSIMCLFGFNAGGGAYLPRQGSFVIQPKNTFTGLTGAEVVKSVLGEEVTPDELGGPHVHSATGVVDYVVEDELDALMLVKKMLAYFPDHSGVGVPKLETQDPIDRQTHQINRLLDQAFASSTGLNTPVDTHVLLQDICDFGAYFEFQPDRARNTLCAWGRLGGLVVGFCANNSAHHSGQIDLDAAYKNARFIRFCNLYNIPMIFMEDTTGFLPGQSQESQGVIQAGRAMLDAIVDLRTPRFLLIIRNAFGGAYASFNNYFTGADLVIALPSTRLAVMGAAGRGFVYKKEIAQAKLEKKQVWQQFYDQAMADGQSANQAQSLADQQWEQWWSEFDQALIAKYESTYMNAREALSLGSISHLVNPESIREALAKPMLLAMRHYEAKPFQSVQREFY